MSHLISYKRFEDKKLRKVDKFYFGDHLMPWLFLVYFIEQSLEWRRRHTYPIVYPSHPIVPLLKITLRLLRMNFDLDI